MLDMAAAWLKLAEISEQFGEAQLFEKYPTK
jgi:hypothetical protein